jgi:pyrroline-5-carboxylate reductase
MDEKNRNCWRKCLMRTNCIHFIGGGQMAEAIIRAVTTNQALMADRITVTDLDEKRSQILNEAYGVQTDVPQETALANADLIVIAVRPQDDLAAVGRYIQQYAKPETAILSIVAGVTMEKLAGFIGEERPIIRCIPNTLTDTGYGYSGVALNSYASKEQVDDFLNGFGKVLYLDESLIDIFTGFGVAGPNYVYYFIESFADAGVLAGLSREQAWLVALENVAGAVVMLKQSGKHPRQLLDINNSAGGVGIHALFELNNSDFAAGLQRSVLSAVKRTTELGRDHK